MTSTIIENINYPDDNKENLIGRLMYGKKTGHIYIMNTNKSGFIVYLGYAKENKKENIPAPYLGYYAKLDDRSSIEEFHGKIELVN